MRVVAASSFLASFLALVAAAACGFVPQDEFSGRRVGDGIAPWTQLGPVQMCLGAEFIGPPGDAPGGMCASINSADAPCLDDGDCRSRESCVCGRCTVQYCTAASDCGGGRVCSFGERRCDVPCATSADCKADREECFNGTCRGRCFEDAECQSGEICNSQNFCIAVACSGDESCLGGERCKIQRLPRMAIEPTVLARARPDEPAFTMWLELSDVLQQDRRAIWRATSHDGIHYRVDPMHPVIDDGGAAHAPAAVRLHGDGGGIAIFYEHGDGAEIRVARSSDGVVFGEAQIAITGSPGGASAVRAPSAALIPAGAGDPGGTIVLYYQVGDGAAIALATGAAAGGTFDLRGPVLTPADIDDPPEEQPAGQPGVATQFWLDIEAVRSPQVLLTQGAAGPSLRLWFSAFGRESGHTFQFGEQIPVPPNYSIGYAVTSTAAPDTAVVWPYNPVFDRVQAFLEHRSELAPAVVQIADADGAPADAYLLYALDAQVETASGPATLGRTSVLGNGGYRELTSSAE